MSMSTLAHFVDVFCQPPGQPPVVFEQQEDIFWLEPAADVCMGIEWRAQQGTIHLFAQAGYAPDPGASGEASEGDDAQDPGEAIASEDPTATEREAFDFGSDDRGHWSAHVDSDSRRITIGLDVALDSLDPASFGATVAAFLDALSWWRSAFDDTPAEAAGPPPDASAWLVAGARAHHLQA